MFFSGLISNESTTALQIYHTTKPNIYKLELMAC